MTPPAFVSLSWIITTLALGELRAQSSDFLEASLAPDTVGFRLEWYGVEGFTYFVQHSADLETWHYLPCVESGAAAFLGYSFGASEDARFVRLVYTDVAPSVLPDDFDGDGIRDMVEIYLGLDPADASDAPAGPDLDADGDSWHDTYEELTGRSTAVNEEKQFLETGAKNGLRVFAPLF